MMSPPLKKYFGRSISIGIPANLGSSFLAFVLIPLILRHAGMANYGIWSLIFIFTGVSSTMDIGLPRALVTLLPKASADEANRLFSASVLLLALLVLLLAGVGAVLIRPGFMPWGATHQIPPSTGILLVLAGICITACCLISSLCYAVLESRYQIHVVNICNFAQTTLTYLLAFLSSLKTPHADALIYSSVASYVLMAGVNILLVFTLTDIRPGQLDGGTFRRLLKVGRGFFAIGVVTTLTLPLMRWIMLQVSSSPSVVGLYDIALKIALTGNGVLTVFSTPLFSLFSSYGSTGIEMIHDLARKTARRVFALLVLGMALTYGAGGWLFKTVLGVQDPSMLGTTCILLAGWGVTATFQPYIRALWALGNTFACTLLNLGTLILTPLLVLCFSGMDNPLYRVALAMASGLAFVGLGHYLVFRHVLRTTYRSLNPAGGGLAG
jgi:O-antigen/teichoic acid export membrane protein